MITIKESQNIIKEFDKIRNWDDFYPMEVFANINEEIGEVWKTFAWETEDKKRELAQANKQKLENDIGDLLFLVLRLGNQFGIDAERGLRNSLKDLKERFPIDSKEKEKEMIESLLNKIS